MRFILRSFRKTTVHGIVVNILELNNREHMMYFLKKQHQLLFQLTIFKKFVYNFASVLLGNVIVRYSFSRCRILTRLQQH